MSVRIGIDPGATGAVAIVWTEQRLLTNGRAILLFDMPTTPRTYGKGEQVDAAALARLFRDHVGASMADGFAIIEQVGAMRREGRQQGATSSFKFGDALGAARAVVEVLGIRHGYVLPAVWKRHYGLLGKPKDASITVAKRLFPEVADHLSRKKDAGRADALLMAMYE